VAAAWVAWAIWICDATTQPQRPGSSEPLVLNFRSGALNSLRRNRSATHLSRSGCIAVLFNRTPQILQPATDVEKDLVEMPAASIPALVSLGLASRAAATELITA
jgi:hypothetical protein